jgi:hypothetical protein
MPYLQAKQRRHDGEPPASGGNRHAGGQLAGRHHRVDRRNGVADRPLKSRLSPEPQPDLLQRASRADPEPRGRRCRKTANSPQDGAAQPSQRKRPLSSHRTTPGLQQLAIDAPQPRQFGNVHAMLKAHRDNRHLFINRWIAVTIMNLGCSLPRHWTASRIGSAHRQPALSAQRSWSHHTPPIFR